MSLGDYLRLLRARRGGITPWEIEAVTNLPKGLYRMIEQRYRAMGDDETIQVLADFYAAPLEELQWRSNWPRKALSHALVAVKEAGHPFTLYLWNGQVVKGKVRWWDLGAIGLERDDGTLLVVQRHATERWEPAAPGA